MNNKETKVLQKIAALAILSGLLLSSCGGINHPQATVEATTAPTSTPVPIKSLVICLGDEPKSLYIYGGNSSQSQWSVLESIYDGPIDTVNFTPRPVILENIPSLDNGGITLQAAAVSAGDLVADTSGNTVALAKGVTVFPTDCTSMSCAVTWDGNSALSLSQMVVKFTLLAGVKWSDGQPLTAADSIYSYQVAADPATKISKSLVNLTASYQALDDVTVTWTGIPGYLTLNPSQFFWSPLPQHVLGQLSASDLATNDDANRNPIGWGPYMIKDWQGGKEIDLVKNPNYFRAGEGLPKFDEIVYRFIGNVPQTDISPVLNGECDIIDTSVNMSDQIFSTIRGLERDGKLKAYYGQGPEWQAIDFGIKPSSYDEVFNPYEDRPNFFADVRTRQAIAYCINRDSILHDNIYSLGDVPNGYLVPNHPYFDKDLPVYAYDPSKGEQLLDEVGWKDTDNDPTTPRVAVGVDTVLDGTPFEITYTAVNTDLNAIISGEVAQDLGACGIGVKQNLVSTAGMYAAGPDGVVFGRNFDLAELGWTETSQNPCFLFTSDEIPTAKNEWLGNKYGGVNVTGYSNNDYDTACMSYLNAGLDADLANTSSQKALELLANDVPFIPLYYQPQVEISRKDLCGLSLDVSARSGLQNIEALDIGTCAN